MREVHISQALFETPWAILPGKMEAIIEVVTRYFAGEKLEADEVQTRIHGARRPDNRMAGNVAVLPLFGTIVPRANLFTQTSGATSAELFGRQFADLIKDPDVSAIVLDVDSPGGQVQGVEELSRQIFEARGKKPVVAVANYLAASAAYWITSAADELVAAPSAEVGSIGVFAAHELLPNTITESGGHKVTFISAGKYKTEGNPYEPLTEEALAAIQQRVDDTYDLFIKAVARNRGVKPSDVRGGYGEGRVANARQALGLGMIDRIATLDETIARLQGGSPTRRGSRADAEFRRRRLRLTEQENTGSVEPRSPER